MYVVNYFFSFFKKALLFSIFLTFNLHPTVSVDHSGVSSESSTNVACKNCKPDMCVNNRSSCTNQINSPAVSEDSCSLIKLDKTSTDCDSSSFKGDEDPTETFGKVFVTPYIISDNYYYIAFNVTFTDIQWERARLRFYESGKQPDICREFQLSDEVTPDILSNVTLFYDCLWTYEPIESKIYHFQYIAYLRSGESVVHQYVFFVPNILTLGVDCHPCPPFRQHLTAKTLQLFLSVDVSVLRKLRLYVQTAHEKFNITKYRVQLIRSLVDEDDKWAVVNKVITVLPNQSYFYFEHDTHYRRGVYNFTVTPIHESCYNEECTVSKAPGIVIVNSPETELLIGMVAAVILIPILIAAYFICRRRWVIPEDVYEPPKVLLVYNPDYKSHVSDMIRFCKYLEECHVKSMLDLFCIPNSKSQNPNSWYSDAFDEADYILVFAPPSGPNFSELHELNTYQNLGLVSLNQLRAFLSNHKIIKVGSSLLYEGNKQIFSVCLPGCDWHKLYSDVKHFKRFSLPGDIEKLLKAIGISGLKNQVQRLTDVLSSEIDRKLLPLGGPVLAPKPCSDDEQEEIKKDKSLVIQVEDEDPIGLVINWDGPNNGEINCNQESELLCESTSSETLDDDDFPGLNL